MVGVRSCFFLCFVDRGTHARALAQTVAARPEPRLEDDRIFAQGERAQSRRPSADTQAAGQAAARTRLDAHAAGAGGEGGERRRRGRQRARVFKGGGVLGQGAGRRGERRGRQREGRKEKHSRCGGGRVAFFLLTLRAPNPNSAAPTRRVCVGAPVPPTHATTHLPSWTLMTPTLTSPRWPSWRRPPCARAAWRRRRLPRHHRQ